MKELEAMEQEDLDKKLTEVKPGEESLKLPGVEREFLSFYFSIWP